jgi:hypothetical protein
MVKHVCSDSSIKQLCGRLRTDGNILSGASGTLKILWFHLTPSHSMVAHRRWWCEYTERPHTGAKEYRPPSRILHRSGNSQQPQVQTVRHAHSSETSCVHNTLMPYWQFWRMIQIRTECFVRHLVRSWDTFSHFASFGVDGAEEGWDMWSASTDRPSTNRQGCRYEPGISFQAVALVPFGWPVRVHWGDHFPTTIALHLHLTV